MIRYGTAVAFASLGSVCGTVLDYVAALTRVFVIEDLPAWSPALRSRSILRQSRTRHCVDPSAVAALDADPTRLLREIETLGLLFESLVVRDLRVYAQGLDANVSHYPRQHRTGG